MRQRGQRDKKLATCRIWLSGVSNRQLTFTIVGNSINHFERNVVVASVTRADPGWVARLRDKIRDDTVPRDVVVKAILRQENEVVDVLRRDPGKKLRHHAPVIGRKDGTVDMAHVDNLRR